MLQHNGTTKLVTNGVSRSVLGMCIVLCSIVKFNRSIRIDKHEDEPVLLEPLRRYGIVLVLLIALSGSWVAAQTVAPPPPGADVFPPGVTLVFSPLPTTLPDGIPDGLCSPLVTEDDEQFPPTTIFYRNCVLEDGALTPGDQPLGETGLQTTIFTLFAPIPPAGTRFSIFTQRSIASIPCDLSALLPPSADRIALVVETQNGKRTKLATNPLLLSGTDPLVVLACDERTGVATFVPAFIEWDGQPLTRPAYQFSDPSVSYIIAEAT